MLLSNHLSDSWPQRKCLKKLSVKLSGIMRCIVRVVNTTLLQKVKDGKMKDFIL